MKHLIKKSIILCAALVCVTSKAFAYEITTTEFCLPKDATHYVCDNHNSIRVEPMLGYEVMQLPGYKAAVMIHTKGDNGPADIYMECIYKATVIEKTDHAFACRGSE